MDTQAIQHVVQSPNYILEFTYLIASILFIWGLKSLSHPDTARRGMHPGRGRHGRRHPGHALPSRHSLLRMDHRRVDPRLAGRCGLRPLGADDGHATANRTQPRLWRVAAALVGIAEFTMHAGTMSMFTRSALGLEVMLGTLTTTGSLIACGKLQGVIRGTPVQFKGQQVLNL